jgi:hypothetical protein
MTTAGKLRAHWKTFGLTTGSRLSPPDIEAFQSLHSVLLPLDLREYFLELNGLAHGWQNEQDPNGFSFWQLSRVAPVSSLKAQHPHLPPVPEADSYFVFADYLQWSWAYAIRLTGDASAQNPVIIVGKEPLVIVATSFSDFVDLYIADAPALYG